LGRGQTTEPDAVARHEVELLGIVRYWWSMKGEAAAVVGALVGLGVSLGIVVAVLGSMVGFPLLYRKRFASWTAGKTRGKPTASWSKGRVGASSSCSLQRTCSRR